MHGAIAWATGDSGECDLWSMLRAPYRISRLRRSSGLSGVQTRLVETVSDGFMRWETPIGSLWVPPGNSPAFVVGEQMSEVYTLPPMTLGPTDVVLDCGANYGSFVRICLRQGVRKVIAIEPDPLNVEALRRNFAREIETGQVVIVGKGVWHEDATLPMYAYRASVLDSFVMPQRREAGTEKPRRVNLPLTTIDSIVEELRLQAVTFIKMDIEGAERNAIRGAAGTIRRFRPRMSLATENLADDYIAVPQEVRKVDANYRKECGLCKQTGFFGYRPEILYFTPQ